MRYHVSFTRAPNALVQTAAEDEDIRRQLVEIIEREWQEDNAIEDAREELQGRYLRRGYRGPLPRLY